MRDYLDHVDIWVYMWRIFFITSLRWEDLPTEGHAIPQAADPELYMSGE